MWSWLPWHSLAVASFHGTQLFISSENCCYSVIMITFSFLAISFVFICMDPRDKLIVGGRHALQSDWHV